MRHRREHARLEPMWTLMCKRHPTSYSRPAPGSGYDRWRRSRNVHRLRHRRVIECRHGLVAIAFDGRPTAGRR
ncbi:DUF6545 domain-containing protein [Streptomyces sp. NPDC058293]|uniref:DUF6545 domain-containing protein n=1 Tax=Streptomyces sp. NPDC058293 TaxID=3346429 RepID=UPI0036E38011